MRLIGLDFSGAVDAGERIWVCYARLKKDTLHIESIMPARDLPGGAPQREPAHAALRAWISQQNAALIGCDFPFSVATGALEGMSWEAFAWGFAERFPTPEHFRQFGDEAAAAARADGRRLIRQTDAEARTPFPPHNLRIYRQTYYGVRELLAPLSQAGSVRVLPMQPGKPGVPSMIEVCPASLLKPIGLYAPYKGAEPKYRQQRARILDYAQDNGVRFGNRTMPALLLDNAGGDALDSVLCAYAAWRALPHLNDTSIFPYTVEGRVYGW